MTRHSQHVLTFIVAVQTDSTLSREEKGRQLFEALNFLEEVLVNYPDPRNEGLDEEEF